MSSPSEDPNEAIAHRIQEKFDFYLLALTFTILGLSVQTAKFRQGVVSDIAELIGWSALLTSGISGLSRLEWLPQLFQAFSYRTGRKVVARNLRQSAARGLADVPVKGQAERLPVESVISKLEDNIVNVDAFVAKLQSKGLAKYRLQRFSFVFGLAALMVARGLSVLVGVFGYALK